VTDPPPVAAGAAQFKVTIPEPGVVAPVVATSDAGPDAGATGVADEVIAAVPLPIMAVLGVTRK